MTFEDEKQKLTEKSFEDDGYATVVKLSNVMQSLDGLQDNYAPTIEMSKAEQVMLLNYLEMSSFREFMEVIMYRDDLYQTLSDEEIAQAWLHPEMIKVVDDVE